MVWGMGVSHICSGLKLLLKARCRSFDVTYSMLSWASVRLCEDTGHLNTALGVEECSLRLETARAGLGFPGPVRKPVSSGSQALRYLWMLQKG